MLIAALAAIALPRPRLLTELTRSVWVPTGDPYVIGDLWGSLFLTVRRSRGEGGCHTAFLQWPDGADLCRDFPNNLFTDLLAPLVGAVGLPLGFNLGMLALLVTNGLAVGLAARLAGAGRWGGWLAAGLGAASPMVFYEVFAGRPVTAWWAPAIAATALCVGSLASWRRWAMLLPGLFCLMVALRIYPYGPAMLLPWTALWGLAALARGPAPWWGRALRAAVGLGAAVAVAWWVSRTEYAGVLARWTRPLPFGDAESRWGLATASVFQGLVHWHGIALLLGGVAGGLVSARRWRGAWAAALLGALALLAVGLGPVPFGDPRQGQPLPGAPFTWLMEQVELMRGCARPDRYVIAASLLLPVAAGVLLAQAGRLRRLGPALGVALFAAVGVFNHRFQPTAYLAWPPVEGLSGLEVDGGVVDAPLFFAGEDQAHMLPIVLMPAPRANPMRGERDNWSTALHNRDAPLLQALYALQQGEPVAGPVAPGAEDPEVVVLHLQLLDEGQREAHRALVAGAEVLEEDAQVEVYRVK